MSSECQPYINTQSRLRDARPPRPLRLFSPSVVGPSPAFPVFLFFHRPLPDFHFPLRRSFRHGSNTSPILVTSGLVCSVDSHLSIEKNTLLRNSPNSGIEKEKDASFNRSFQLSVESDFLTSISGLSGVVSLITGVTQYIAVCFLKISDDGYSLIILFPFENTNS